MESNKNLLHYISTACNRLEERMNALESNSSNISLQIRALSFEVQQIGSMLESLRTEHALIEQPSSVSMPQEFIPRDLILRRPDRRMLNCDKSDMYIKRIEYFIRAWKGNEVVAESGDLGQINEKNSAMYTYYKDLQEIGPIVLNKELLAMKLKGINWKSKAFSKLDLEQQERMIQTYHSTATELGIPVNRCENRWISDIIVKYMYRNRKRGVDMKADDPEADDTTDSDELNAVPNKRQ
ncbi:hypothetical protein EDC96DRAFT_154062 [Choanephora cucurbitarum]|nr:hypothetical protein EDC96DRAFT_154062 [Choanephora cucurbitarum]